MGRRIVTGERPATGTRSEYPWDVWFSQEGLLKGQYSEYVVTRYKDGKAFVPNMDSEGALQPGGEWVECAFNANDHFPDNAYFANQVRLTALKKGADATASMSHDGNVCSIRTYKTSSAKAEELRNEYKEKSESWTKARKERKATNGANGESTTAAPESGSKVEGHKSHQGRQRKLAQP